MLGSISEGPSSGLRFSKKVSSSDGMNRYGMRYPSPFFDVAQTYLPTSIKSMLRFCRYYFLTNPLINAVVWKMAEYPVTEILYKTENESLRKKYKNLGETILNLRSFIIEANLDYGTYGNAFVSVSFPFKKYLVCKGCGTQTPVKKAKYKFYSLKYHLTCNECGKYGEAAVHDDYLRAVNDIRLVRWNPEYMTIDYNTLTGESVYYFTPPPTLKNDITMGKRAVIETIPHIFVEGVRLAKSVVFTKENLFHLKRPTIANKDMGWGTPMILPVLKDTYYMQVLRKAQEAIMLHHITPMRVLFPQAGDATSSPFTNVDLGSWRDEVEKEVELWTQDPNRIPVLPLPIGQESIGGEGRALMLFQELRMWSEQIVVGMGVPTDFVFGGATYASSSVNMRMLENQFIVHRSRQTQLVQFILSKIAFFMGWPQVDVGFGKFKMADDLQRSSYLMQLNQAGKVSNRTLLQDVDIDHEQESAIIERETGKDMQNQSRQAIAQANLQGETQLASARWQQKAQELMMAAQQQQQAAQGMSPEMAAQQQAAGPEQQAGQEQEAAPQGQEGGEEYAAQMPGMPEGATAYQENLMPDDSQSPIGVDSMGGNGIDILQLARRAAIRLMEMGDAERMQVLQEMRMRNPAFFDVVVQILQAESGSQNPAGQPLPEQKPPRRGPEHAIV